MYTQLTEEQIERRAERGMNALDRALMRGALTQAEYDVEVKKLDRVTARALAQLSKGR